MEDRETYQAQQNTAKIETFVRGTAREKRTYASLGRRVLLLDLPTQRPVPDERLERYVQQHVVASARDIFNRCVFIAHDAVTAGAATGSLYTSEGVQGFVGWVNHCINYDVLGDGTVVGFDLTAGSNIEHTGDLFDILAIRDRDVTSLRASIGALFGGDWGLQTPLG